ncbi:MAG: gamma-glutamylcyclotransferase [Pseudomonadota bacterium]
MIINYLSYIITFLFALHALFLVYIVFSTRKIFNRPISKNLNVAHGEDQVLYFAYGANMSRRYLTNIRNIQVLDTKRAILNGYTLTFNLKGRNFLEPGFSNISPSENEHVEGVVHRISKQDLDKIQKSEPAQYKMTDIEVVVDGEKVTAKTFVHIAEPNVSYRPSKRYLKLLTDAAKEHGLSETYIAKLHTTKHVYFPGLSESYGAVIYYYLIKKSSRK